MLTAYLLTEACQHVRGSREVSGRHEQEGPRREAAVAQVLAALEGERGEAGFVQARTDGGLRVAETVLLHSPVQGQVRVRRREEDLQRQVWLQMQAQGEDPHRLLALAD